MITLPKCSGVGVAKVNAIMAAAELGRRRQVEAVKDIPCMNCAQTVYDRLKPMMAHLEYEMACVLLMNNSLKLLKVVKLSTGGLTETAVDVRVIMREAVLHNATAIALAHNHPSGNCLPSRMDDEVTKRVHKACETMRIAFTDHLIITESNYYSYQDNGRM